MKKLFVLLSGLALSACASMGLNAPSSTQVVEFTNAPSIGKTAAGQELYLGGFSAFVFHRKTADNHFRFRTLTDRGPITWSGASEGIQFLLPSFTPRVVELDVDFANKKATVVKEILLRNESGEPMNGLPTEIGQVTATDTKGNRLPVGKRGIDPEALAVLPNGSFWVAEEYEPSLLHFYANGKLARRFSPGNGLPVNIADRKSNRGFEGLVYLNGKLYAFLQSPMKKGSRWVRVVEFDPWRSKTLRQMVYPLESTSAEKISDAAVSKSGKVFVVESDGEKGSRAFKRVYEVDFTGASDVSKVADMENLTAEDFLTRNIQPLRKTLVKDLATSGFSRWEKAEGLAVVDEKTIAVVSDNDFGLDGTLDMEKGIAGTKDEPSAFLLFSIPD